MAGNRFASMAVKSYPLADGQDSVDFKESLTFAEKLRMMASYTRFVDGQGEIDWSVYQTRRLFAYLAGWSFQADGREVEISQEAVDALDEETGRELIDLLERHLAEMDALKNSPGSTAA